MKEYSFSSGGRVLTIYNSYAYPKSKFQPELNKIKALHGQMPIFQRSDCSLKKEWATHNFLYMIGYEKERTKDCDFDIPSDHPEWLYKLIGTLVWPFIK